MIRPIHFIRRWSGNVADESPICGADKWDPAVWGNRTQYPRHVTCERCRELLQAERAPEGERV
jgi:hypothetical protein